MEKKLKVQETDFQRIFRKRNEKFLKMNPAQQRMALAQDALQQIKEGVYIPEEGVYLRVDELEFGLPKKSELNELIEEGKIECAVCAKGALLMSHIVFNDKAKLRQKYTINNHTAINRRLKGIFSKDQLSLIEVAFEKNIAFFRKGKPEIVQAALKFGKRFRTNKGRLIAILKNIIENKGEFNPFN